jgi:hypothetical protein
LTRIAKPAGDDQIFGDFLEVRRNALAQFVRHVSRAEHPADALECQRWIAGFRRSRNVTASTLMRPALLNGCTTASDVDKTWMRL